MNGYLVKQCVKITSPIFFGYIAIGIPFGIMVVHAGYPWWMSPFMSLTMFSGAGQYIAIGLLTSGAALPEIFLTEVFVSIRHIVYGLSLLDKTSGIGLWKVPVIYTLSDETYAILSSMDAPHSVNKGAFMALIGILDFSYWFLGCLVGAVACNVLEYYNLAQYLNGVDFALTALFVLILTGQIKGSRDFFSPAVGAVCCLVSILLYRLGFLGSSNVIFASLLLGLNVLILSKNESGSLLSKSVATCLCLGLCMLMILFNKSSFFIGSNYESLLKLESLGKIESVIAVALFSGVVIFLERLFPFALFSKKSPPPVLYFIEKYIPSMVIEALVVYSIKDVAFTSMPFGIPHLSAIVLTVFLDFLLGNPMATIFGGTAVYILLQNIMQAS